MTGHSDKLGRCLWWSIYTHVTGAPGAHGGDIGSPPSMVDVPQINQGFIGHWIYIGTTVGRHCLGALVSGVFVLVCDM